MTWASATTAVATISSRRAWPTAVATGTTHDHRHARRRHVGSTDTLTVTAAALVSIAVTPANPSIAKGLTQQFTATGTFTDNSTQNLTSQVTWASADHRGRDDQQRRRAWPPRLATGHDRRSPPRSAA